MWSFTSGIVTSSYGSLSSLQASSVRSRTLPSLCTSLSMIRLRCTTTVSNYVETLYLSYVMQYMDFMKVTLLLLWKLLNDLSKSNNTDPCSLLSGAAVCCYVALWWRHLLLIGPYQNQNELYWQVCLHIRGICSAYISCQLIFWIQHSRPDVLILM